MTIGWEEEREQVASIMRRLYRQGLTTCSGGNVSLRCGGVILITPSGTDKGEITAGEIGAVTPDGENLLPGLKLSIETEMHLEVYRNRPDVNGVVHAHPVTASAFAALDRDIETRLTAETRHVLGKPVRAVYALMGTKELARVVGQAVRKGNVVIMENHGALTAGETLFQAFDRMELLEAAAKMTWITHTMGSPRPLSEARIKEIEEVYGRRK
ncbi:MAG: L-fuculose-phosphate aldolase [Synergistaceae bacterium]|jgi:L-fuculose-phosphate aldolase|nr:L-fuculose-phosphate aldolase [Synergistaceae bacterium]